MQRHLKTLDDWKVFRSKGPVRIPSAQYKAYKAFQSLQARLTTDEVQRLRIAQAHAFTGEGS